MNTQWAKLISWAIVVNRKIIIVSIWMARSMWKLICPTSHCRATSLQILTSTLQCSWLATRLKTRFPWSLLPQVSWSCVQKPRLQPKPLPAPRGSPARFLQNPLGLNTFTSKSLLVDGHERHEPLMDVAWLNISWLKQQHSQSQIDSFVVVIGTYFPHSLLRVGNVCAGICSNGSGPIALLPGPRLIPHRHIDPKSNPNLIKNW